MADLTLTRLTTPDIEVQAQAGAIINVTVQEDEGPIITIEQVPEISVTVDGAYQGGSAAQSGSAAQTVQKIAGANLSGHRIVATVSSSEVDYASASDPTTMHRIVGMTTGAALLGDTVTVLLSGHVIESSWNWDLSLPVYLGENGLLTQSAPASGYILQVGRPASPTEMIFEIQLPIMTG